MASVIVIFAKLKICYMFLSLVYSALIRNGIFQAGEVYLGDNNSLLIFSDFFLLQEQSLKNNKLPPPQQVRRSKSRETLISNGDGDNTSEANFMARPATVISNTSGSSTASGNSNNL